MATIRFYGNEPNANASDLPDLINHTANSGLGFFGGSFGISVPVNEYQTSTYVTNANGTASGINVSNTKYVDNLTYPGSGIQINNLSVTGTSGCPNYRAPLNIRFEHDEAVRVQNCKLRIFDRDNIQNHASGVTTQVYEIRHPHSTVSNNAKLNGPLKFRGTTDDHEWKTFVAGTAMSDLTLTPGPGRSGLNTSSDETNPELDGSIRNWLTQDAENHRTKRHDWYIALSASPGSIGSKTDFGLYFTLEYL
jgi:hypothetical protein